METDRCTTRARPPGPPFLLLAAATLAAVLAASAPHAAAGEPVPAHPLSPEDRDAVWTYFASRLGEVRRLAEEGKFEKALALAKAIEDLAPEGWPGAETARDLKVRARDGLQSALQVRGDIALPEGFLQVGDPLRLRVAVSNLSGVPLEIDFGGDACGASALRVAFEETGPLGEGRGIQWDEPLPGFSGRRVLPPRGTWEIDVALDSGALAPFAPTVRTYRFGGMVRPAAMRLGDRPLQRPILLAEAVLRVFPRGLGPMRRAPAETLKEGVEEEFGAKVFLAAHFIPREETRAAASFLEESLHREFENPSLPRSIRAALRVLLGSPEAPLDPEAWKRWWADRGRAAADALGGGGAAAGNR